METLSIFKISENSSKFDIVELIYDEVYKKYIVRYKWGTMKEPIIHKYENIEDARKFYKARKAFAIFVNK